MIQTSTLPQQCIFLFFGDASRNLFPILCSLYIHVASLEMTTLILIGWADTKVLAKHYATTFLISQSLVIFSLLCLKHESSLFYSPYHLNKLFR
jgi:hypothetical protein